MKERTLTTKGREYEYRSMRVSTWDPFRPGAENWPDVALYRDLILDDGQPALDVACSTGRLVLRYRSEGLDVDGVDASPEMLEICRGKAQALGVEGGFFQQHMQELSLPRTYRTIIVSSGSFGLLTDPEDARRALGRFFEHLEPGGRLIMSVIRYQPDQATGEWELDGEAVRPEDGALIRRWSKAAQDPPRVLQHTEDRFEVIIDGEVAEVEHHHRSPAFRWYPEEEVRSLLSTAGFKDPEVRGSFANHPVFSSDRAFIVEAIRP